LPLELENVTAPVEVNLAEAEPGWKILFGLWVPGSTFVILLSLVPLGDPNDGVDRNATYVIIYFGILPMMYTFLILEAWHFKIEAFTEVFSKERQRWTTAAHLGFAFVVGCCSSSVCFSLAKTSLGFPLKYSFLYSFLVIFVMFTGLYSGRALRAWHQADMLKLAKFGFMLLTIVCLAIGWTFAALAMRFFNSSGVVVQTSIIVGIAIWRGLVSSKYIRKAFSATHLHGAKFDLMIVAWTCVSVQWFWTLFTDIAFASVESPLSFVAYFAVDVFSALVYVFKCSQFYQRTIWKRSEDEWFPRPHKIPTEHIDRDFILNMHYDILFNFTCFVLVQFGELAFASYVFVLFLTLRHGPNAAYTPLDPAILSQDEFWHVQTFLAVVIVCELATSIATTKLAIHFLRFDPRRNLGVFLANNIISFIVMPILLHFPVLALIFTHSGMGFAVGKGGESG
jgi:hypothetical protein